MAKLAIFVVLPIAYVVVWLSFSLPYIPYPSDDLSAVLIAADFQKSINSHNPFYHFVVYVVYAGCRIFGQVCDPGTTIEVIAVASSAASIAVLGLLTLRLTTNLASALIAEIIYAASAWPVSYFFHVSYTTLSTLLAILVFWFIVEAFMQERHRKWMLVLAGLFGGLLFWTSPSALIVLGFFVLLILLLSADDAGINRHVMDAKMKFGADLWLFAAGFLSGMALFSASFPELYRHLSDNMASWHYVFAAAKFNYIPLTPFFSFHRVLYLYSHVLAITYIVVVAVGVAIIIRRHSIPYDRKTRVLFVVLILVALHPILIDLSPFTKLGRAHFIAYPFTILAIVASGYLLAKHISSSYSVSPRYFAVLFACLTGISVYEGVATAADTVITRRTLGGELAKLPAGYETYVLRQDPHAKYLIQILNYNHIREGRKELRMIDFPKFANLLGQSDSQRARYALLLGPRGEGSGISGFYHGYLPDFNPATSDDFRSLYSNATGKIEIPFHAYYPPFLMEEEILQALYFEGKIPNYKTDSEKQLLLLVF